MIATFKRVKNSVMNLYYGDPAWKVVFWTLAFTCFLAVIDLGIGSLPSPNGQPFVPFYEPMYIEAGFFSLICGSFYIFFVSFSSTRLTSLIPVSLQMVLVIIGFAIEYTVWGISDTSAAEAKQFVYDFGNCLYFSVVTFTTLGYGDFRPSPSSRVFAAAEALAGYLFFGLFVSLLAAHFAKKTSAPDGNQNE